MKKEKRKIKRQDEARKRQEEIDEGLKIRFTTSLHRNICDTDCITSQFLKKKLPFTTSLTRITELML